MAGTSTGATLNYDTKATYSFASAVTGDFKLNLLNNNSAGVGFDKSVLTVYVNGAVDYTHTFTDLSSAQSFFKSNLVDLGVSSGAKTVTVDYSWTGSKLGGFSFNYGVSVAAGVPEISANGALAAIMSVLAFAAMLWERRRCA